MEAWILAVDVFTGKKSEEYRSHSCLMYSPYVTYSDFLVLDVERGRLYFIKEDASTKDDIALPSRGLSRTRYLRDAATARTWL